MSTNPKTILVADDESHILHVVSMKLRNAGFRVVTARDGREAFEMALLAEVERRRVPSLFICLGCQLLNVYRGGSLTQFLPDEQGKLEHRKGQESVRRHEVRIGEEHRAQRRHRLLQWQRLFPLQRSLQLRRPQLRRPQLSWRCWPHAIYPRLRNRRWRVEGFVH